LLTFVPLVWLFFLLTLDDEGNGGSNMVQGVMIECAKLRRSSRDLVHIYMIAIIVIHFIHEFVLKILLYRFFRVRTRIETYMTPEYVPSDYCVTVEDHPWISGTTIL
jgi:hypothetical protein